MNALLTRYYTPFGTWGDFRILDGKSQDFTMSTIEPPWAHNKQNESCIPEGEYTVSLMDSDLIDRITVGDYVKTYRLLNVRHRFGIEFHPGNVISDTEGCILMGSDKAIVDNGLWVIHSRKTFRAFMAACNGIDTFQLKIQGMIAP